MTARRIWPLAAGVLLMALMLAVVNYAVNYLPMLGFLAKQPAPTPEPAATRDGRWQQVIA